MLTLKTDIENKIEAIQLYYKNKEKIDKLKFEIEKYKVKIQELDNQINMLQNRINKELNGEYSEVISFEFENGKPVSKLINKKIHEGSLEGLLPYLTKRTADSAINNLLKDYGAQMNHNGDIWNIDDFYEGENNFNPRVSSQEVPS